MRIIKADGVTVIDEDNDVLDRLVGADHATFKSVDISRLRLNADNLAVLYDKAQRTKTPEDAGAYKRFKEKFLAWVNG
ncbi:hypothetical protein [Fontibacillus sp. BL9]|uniref:hypothetical protein n=1 Tax=Fontibacillus sp. BL9 TaxID=3389971 RepID=UPI00397CA578